MKKLFLSIIGAIFFMVANAGVTPVEGVDYTIIPNSAKVVKSKSGKVNVKEFFSFTCMHCKDVEPLVQEYIATNKNIDMQQIQVVWGSDANMVAFAKLNATIQLLKLNKLYIPAFNAVFARQNINDPMVLKTFLASNGLTKAQIDNFLTMYNSFDISMTVGKYKSMTEDTKYNITCTPTFIVADKYIVSPAQPPRLIEVVKALVNKVSHS